MPTDRALCAVAAAQLLSVGWSCLRLRLRSNYFVNAFGPHVTNSRLVARHYRRARGTLALAFKCDRDIENLTW